MVRRVTIIENKLRCVDFNSFAKKSQLRPVVECEKCGCLLDKNTAIKGKKKIVTVEKTENFGCRDLIYDEEIIKQNYYCKIHAPKKKS